MTAFPEGTVTQPPFWTAVAHEVLNTPYSNGLSAFAIGNAKADSAYAAVVAKYADSPRAPTALYKRGVMAQTARRTTAAKRLYNELIDKYPSSDEAELARERLRVLG